jgi:hypothetical protein
VGKIPDCEGRDLQKRVECLEDQLTTERAESAYRLRARQIVVEAVGTTRSRKHRDRLVRFWLACEYWPEDGGIPTDRWPRSAPPHGKTAA